MAMKKMAPPFEKSSKDKKSDKAMPMREASPREMARDRKLMKRGK
jgi:hypothetical protein